MHLLHQVTSAMSALLGSTATQQDVLCRLLGDCRAGPAIDMEIGDLRGGQLLRDPLFTYARYDMDLTRANLDALGFPDVPLNHVLPIDSVAHVDTLSAVGAAVADRVVDLAHLDGFVPGGP